MGHYTVRTCLRSVVAEWRTARSRNNRCAAFGVFGGRIWGDFLPVHLGSFRLRMPLRPDNGYRMSLRVLRARCALKHRTGGSDPLREVSDRSGTGPQLGEIPPVTPIELSDGPSPRFDPDKGDRAYLCFNPYEPTFVVDVVGEILNESHTGCGVVLYPTNRFQKGDVCLAKIGRADPVRATVVWRKIEDEMVVRIGLEYGKTDRAPQQEG